MTVMTQTSKMERGTESWSRFIDSASHGILILQTDGVCRDSNRVADVLLGYPEVQMRSAPLHSLLHPGEENEADCAFLKALRPENAWRLFQEVLATGSGERIEVELSVWPVYREGQLDAFSLSFQRRGSRANRAEEMVRNARQANVAFMGTSIVHEFNNILMGIAPFASIVIRKGSADPQLVKAGEHIQTAVTRAKHVATEILSFTAPPSAERSALDLGSWLRDTVLHLRELVPPAVDLRLELAGTELWVSADRAQLTHLLTNLILNAREAIGTEGSITITARRGHGDGVLHLEVVDTGRGIPPEAVTRMFEPLFVPRSSTGSGLGLAVCRRIVESHQGTIEVAAGEGSGTRISITLPELPATSQR